MPSSWQTFHMVVWYIWLCPHGVFHYFFFSQKGIIEPKSFFPAADCGYGKKYPNSWGILGAFNLKTCLPSCLLPPLLHAPHPFIFPAHFPLSSHFPSLFSAYSYCTDLVQLFLTWGFLCDHMHLSLPFYFYFLVKVRLDWIRNKLVSPSYTQIL